MAFHSELSVADVGTAGHAASTIWIQRNLSQTFDVVLHEPLPPALLAILDARAEADAASTSVQDELSHLRF